MYKSNQNEQITKISNLIASKTNKFEVIIALVLLIALLINLTTKLNVSNLYMILLNILAIFYFLNAFSVSDDNYADNTEKLIYKLAWISLSVAVMGIVFNLQNWPGYNFIGYIALIILIPIILVIKIKKPDLEIFNKRLLIRIIVIVAIGLFINLASSDNLIKMGLQNNHFIEQYE